MTTTRLWLLRHGEPEDAARGRCYGRLDVGLSGRGRQQAERAAVHLAGESLDAIYASPRKRAAESAGIIAASHACGVRTLADLREIDFGDFEGLTYDEIALRHPGLYRQWMETPTEVRFPNGESFALMRERVSRAVSLLLDRHAGRNLAVVTHGGVVRSVLADVLEIPPPNVFRIGQAYAALNLIRYVDGYPVVELVNGRAF